MLCLLLETTSPKGSLGLYSLNPPGAKARAHPPLPVQTWEGPGHSAFITKALESILNDHPGWFSQEKDSDKARRADRRLCQREEGLRFLALGVGPGRFTGVRVGVSFAKAVSFALRVPVYPVSSLKILAESQMDQEKPVLVLLNAFKNSMYMALYQKKIEKKTGKIKEIIPPCVILARDLEQKLPPGQALICVGDGYPAYKAFFSQDLKKQVQFVENIFPSTKLLYMFLKREFNSGGLIHWQKLKPVYLRSPVRLMT